MDWRSAYSWDQQGFGGSKNLRPLLCKELRFAGMELGLHGRDFSLVLGSWDPISISNV
jgi:hypothetical protein